MDTRASDEAAYGNCHIWVRILFNIIASLHDCEPPPLSALRDTAYTIKSNEQWDAAVNMAHERANRRGLSVHYERARKNCEEICLASGVDFGTVAVLMDAAGILSVRHLLSDESRQAVEEYLARLAVLTSACAQPHNGHKPCGDLSCLSCYHHAVRIISAHGSAKVGDVVNSYVGFVPSLAITMMVKRLTNSH